MQVKLVAQINNISEATIQIGGIEDVSLRY